MEMPHDALRARIERAVEELGHRREPERAFEFRRFTGITIPVTRLTPVELASLGGARGGDVQELTLEELLVRHVERTDIAVGGLSPRCEALRDAIHASLDDVRVVRHGSTEVRCFVLGNDPATGEIAGLEARVGGS